MNANTPANKQTIKKRTMEKFIEKYSQWFPYCEKDKLKEEMKRDLSVMQEKEVKKSVCDCGKPIDSRYAPCCSLKCWDKKFL